MAEHTSVTFDAAPPTLDAMANAAAYEEISRTDAINRAVQLYAAVLAAPRGEVVVFDLANGGEMRLMIGART